MTELFLGPLKSWTRTTAIVIKDVIEVIRRPGALFSLIFGPFIIMGLFGLGYSGQYRPLETILVIPTSSNLPHDAGFYQQYVGDSVHLTGITDNVDEARQRLLRQRAPGCKTSQRPRASCHLWSTSAATAGRAGSHSKFQCRGTPR